MKIVNRTYEFKQLRFIYFGIAILVASRFCLAAPTFSEEEFSRDAKRPAPSNIETVNCGPHSSIGLECILENCLQSKNPSQSCYSAANIATKEQCKYMGGAEMDSIDCSNLRPIPTLRHIFRRYIFFQCCSAPEGN